MYRILRLPVSHFLPLLGMILLASLLTGCQTGSDHAPMASSPRESPEGAVRNLIGQWSAEERPLVHILGQAGSATPSLGAVTFTDLSQNQWRFDIYEIQYLSEALAVVKTQLSPGQVPDADVQINFTMNFVDAAWHLEDVQVERLPQVVVVEGFGVKGYVRDAAGQPVQNAAVALYLGDVLVDSILTDANGYYFLAATTPGIYTVTAAKDGFEFFTRSNVEIK